MSAENETQNANMKYYYGVVVYKMELFSSYIRLLALCCAAIAAVSGPLTYLNCIIIIIALTRHTEPSKTRLQFFCPAVNFDHTYRYNAITCVTKRFLFNKKHDVYDNCSPTSRPMRNVLPTILRSEDRCRPFLSNGCFCTCWSTATLPITCCCVARRNDLASIESSHRNCISNSLRCVFNSSSVLRRFHLQDSHHDC
jgi:hypothetical protein